MELQIPLRVAEAILFAGVLLDLHQLHDILFGHLGGSEFGDVAFDQLARLQQLKRTGGGELDAVARHHQVFLLVGHHVDPGSLAHVHIAFHFQHDDRFAHLVRLTFISSAMYRSAGSLSPTG